MIDPKKIDELAKRMADSLPSGLQTLRKDLERSFRAILQSSFAKMDLVGREEFDVQRDVLARTRAKLESLEKQVAVLEEQLDEK